MTTTHLPSTGFIRAADLLQFLPFSKSTLWAWSKDGRFPSPIRINSSITCWACEDVWEWLKQNGCTPPVDNAA